MRSLSRALLVLNVLYCMLAAVQEGLPGWHMFESVEALDFTLQDREGRDVDVRAALPAHAWLVDYGELTRVVRFVCERERARSPFVFTERVRGVRQEIGRTDCRVHATR